jgi:hypothetical protein
METMKKDKQDKLRQAGWKVGDADSFLNQQMTEVTLCEKPDRNGMRQCVTIEESALREAGYVKATEFAEKVRECSRTHEHAQNDEHKMRYRDTEILNWLIDNGACSYIDHDEIGHPHITGILERREKVRDMVLQELSAPPTSGEDEGREK